MTIGKRPLRVTLLKLPDLFDLERDWRDLEGRSDRSFFVSWSWIGAWLRALPSSTRLELLRVESQGSTVALGILVSNLVKRHRVFSSRALFLNSTGNPELDQLTIEYNGLLCERGFEMDAARSCVEYLASHDDWDEWFIDGLHGVGPTRDVTVPGVRWVTRRQTKCHYVDLESLRRAGGHYLDLLGANTRYNIRRSIREFEKVGPLVLECASTQEQASTFLARLKPLHQAYWQAKGQPGSFANSFFDDFHAHLVRTLFAEGLIQLLELRAGNEAIGYLYNFVDRGRVYNYQSGYNYSLCPNTQGRPGLIAHAYAVEFNRAQGHTHYEFMAGDTRYKQALGVGQSDMFWFVAQRTRLKFLIEDRLRSAWIRINGFVSEVRNRRRQVVVALSNQSKSRPAAAQRLK